MRNFFKGISFSSICAGALAAVTSFLFSAKIGIAGSVIGVAAGSIVSAVATQVYKNVLKASGEKIQNAVPLPSSGDSEKKEDTASATNNATTSVCEKTRVISSVGDTDETVVLPASAQPTRNISGTEHTRIQNSGQTGVRSTGGNRFNTWLQGKHAPIVIAVISALIGVAISAGLILAFTGGKGTDTVVREKIVHSYTDTGRDSQEQTPSSGHTTDSSTSKGNSSDGAQSDGGQSGTSDSTNSGTSNGTSGNSGSSNAKSGSTSNDSAGTSTNDSSNQQGSGMQDSTSQNGGSSGNDSTDGSTGTDESGTSSSSTSSGDSSGSVSSDSSNGTDSSN